MGFFFSNFCGLFRISELKRDVTSNYLAGILKKHWHKNSQTRLKNNNILQSNRKYYSSNFWIVFFGKFKTLKSHSEIN